MKSTITITITIIALAAVLTSCVTTTTTRTDPDGTVTRTVTQGLDGETVSVVAGAASSYAVSRAIYPDK